MTQETGKPITQALSEVKGYIAEFEYFMDTAVSVLRDEVTHEDKDSIHKIVYEPFGVVGVITPWNFPFGMAIWGIIPNLIVGNTVVFKISEECPLVGKLVQDVIDSHSLPQGVFSEVYGAGNVGEILAKSDINYIWFTGSTTVGQKLYKIAGKKFIKVLLEMGGSNPCIVFEDADLKVALQTIYEGRFQNCGQVCDAIKRVIVHESVADEVIQGLSNFLSTKKVGDPAEKNTDIGSLVAKRQLVRIKEQFDDAIQKGDTVIAGGDGVEGYKGAYFQPTILTDISRDMAVWHEETFGPLLPFVTFKTEEEALELANVRYIDYEVEG